MASPPLQVLYPGVQPGQQPEKGLHFPVRIHLKEIPQLFPIPGKIFPEIVVRFFGGADAHGPGVAGALAEGDEALFLQDIRQLLDVLPENFLVKSSKCIWALLIGN